MYIYIHKYVYLLHICIYRDITYIYIYIHTHYIYILYRYAYYCISADLGITRLQAAALEMYPAFRSFKAVVWRCVLWVPTLGLQIAQSRSYVCTLGFQDPVLGFQDPRPLSGIRNFSAPIILPLTKRDLKISSNVCYLKS